MVLAAPVAVSKWEQDYRQLLQDVVGVHGKVRLEVRDGQESVNALIDVGLSGCG